MSSAQHTRRGMLAGSMAVLTAPAALAATAPHADPELRSLWTQYCRHLDEYEAARSWHEPLRAAVNTEVDPLRERASVSRSDADADAVREAWQKSWEKHKVAASWKAVNATADAMKATIEAIRATGAETIFGVGVKLAALPAGINDDPADYEENLRSVLPDIDRICGARFSETLPPDEEDEAGDEEDEADEAV